MEAGKLLHSKKKPTKTIKLITSLTPADYKQMRGRIKRNNPRPIPFCPIQERKRAEMEYHRSLVKYWAEREIN
jgi:hypothetical protein